MVPRTTSTREQHDKVPAFSALPLEQQRFALLIVDAFKTAADESAMTESDVRNLVYRVL